MRRKIALAAALLLGPPGFSRAENRPPPRAFVFDVSPSLELLGLLQAAAYPERHEARAAGIGHPYLRRARKRRFRRLGDHPAVAWYSRWTKRGEPEMLMAEAFLYLGSPPLFAGIEKIPEDILGRLGGKEDFAGFLSQLRDFSERARFLSFFASEGEAYKRFLDLAETEARSDVPPEELAAYLGEPFPSRYRFLLAPLFAAEPHRMAMRWDPGAEEALEARFLDAQEGFALGRPGTSVSHDLAHGVTSRWSALYAGELERFGPPPPGCRRASFVAWGGCLDEHVVVALMLRLSRARIGEKEYAEELEREDLPELALVAGLLESYESDRKSYPALKDFYPRIIAALQERLRRH